MAKMGRPFAENPKNVQITIRVTADEKAALDEYSARHDQTMTQTLVSSFKYMLAHEKRKR
ncbi:hypothetical protein [Butyrivibrio sp. INlla16]|uniref:hypothetical protein n=1 Tax=Butyrivibrio sp. INlla16 TaxID=1520807 RepID=UPI0008842073|nr:hypothetical protein [Butyrivibrio sp. INlla16]SDB51609.1 hypothetical protein SAMN02910263_02592 [Butyrivibrio sp. INlla16]